MKPFADLSAIELLPHNLAEQGSNNAAPAGTGSPDVPRSRRTARIARGALFYLPLLAAFVPIILLLAYSHKLSRHLGSNGCMPNGEFVLPFTSSIWSSSQFFAITIGFTGPRAHECSSSPGILGLGQSWDQACTGYDFSTVKVIDVAFDVLVGRAGQLLLATLAYRLFGQALTHLMQQGEVGYDLFSAVAFQSGSLASVLSLLKHAIGSAPLPRTTRARWLYFLMGLATVYIVAIPTLVSAMSGYSSHFVPYVSNTTVHYQANREIAINHTQSVVDCNGSIDPVWGMFLNKPSVKNSVGGTYNFQTTPLIRFGDETGWNEYLQRYEPIYDECRGQNFSTCPAAQVESSYVSEFRETLELLPPVAQIETWTSSAGYSHWDCGEQIVLNDWLDSGGWSSEDGLTSIHTIGFCMSGQNYLWGFSFMLTFVVSVLHLVFTLLMYAIWFNVRAHTLGTPKESHSLFFDATLMVTSAQAQYGDQLCEWSAKTLERDIVKGKKGLTLQKTSHLRKRRSHYDLGDPREGDWGGDVIF